MIIGDLQVKAEINKPTKWLNNLDILGKKCGSLYQRYWPWVHFVLDQYESPQCPPPLLLPPQTPSIIAATGTHQFVRDPSDLRDLVGAERESYLSEVVIHVVVVVQLNDQDQLPVERHRGTRSESKQQYSNNQRAKHPSIFGVGEIEDPLPLDCSSIPIEIPFKRKRPIITWQQFVYITIMHACTRTAKKPCEIYFKYDY